MAADVDLRLIRYAVVLAEELHFGRAASRLFVTQQTLSAQIARLEQRLGSPLFTRNSRSVELTALGEFLVDEGRKLLISAQSFMESLNRPSSLVRVDAAAETVLSSYLLHAMQQDLGEIELGLQQSHGLSFGINRLLEKKTEIAFGRSIGMTLKPESRLQHELVRLEPIGILVPALHILAKLDFVPLPALSRYPILLHSSEHDAEWRDWNEKLADDFSLSFGLRVIGLGQDLANAAALTSGLPSFAPMGVTAPEGLVWRPVVDPTPLYPWSMLWSVDRACGPVGRVLAKVRQISAQLSWRELPVSDWWLPDGDFLAIAETLRKPGHQSSPLAC